MKLRVLASAMALCLGAAWLAPSSAAADDHYGHARYDSRAHSSYHSGRPYAYHSYHAHHAPYHYAGYRYVRPYAYGAFVYPYYDSYYYGGFYDPYYAYGYYGYRYRPRAYVPAYHYQGYRPMFGIGIHVPHVGLFVGF